MRQNSKISKFIFATIIPFMVGMCFVPQAHASKFRGIVGVHYGSGTNEIGVGGGFSTSFGIQTSKLFFIGAGINFSSYNNADDAWSLFVNPRVDFFKSSKTITPYISGRLGYQFADCSSPYYGFDLGMRFNIKNKSKGASLGIGVESLQTGPMNYRPVDYSESSQIVILARLAFEF